MLTVTQDGGGALYTLARGRMTACVAPGRGMNLLALRAGSRVLIRPDEERRKAGKTDGAPILYPTPNRVRGGITRWPNARPTPGRNHGFARLCAFEVTQAGEKADETFVEGILDITRTHPWFAQCPFPHTLSVRVALGENTLRWAYTVKNCGDSALWYGFGLHPFFQNADGRARLRVNGKSALVRDLCGNVTGEYGAVAQTPLDFRSFRPIRGASLNNAYLVSPDDAAEILFPGIRLHMRASQEFRYIVAYTPTDDCFCVESQTCAPDAHFLHASGHPQAAGLSCVLGGERASGFIQWTFSSAPDRGAQSII